MEAARVYLDNAASTRPAPEVAAAVADAAARLYANPSSMHVAGAEAARALEEARAAILETLGTDQGRLIFTSGGTEANALGVLGAAAVARGRHVIVSGLEHPAVLRNVERLSSANARAAPPTVATPGGGAFAASVIAPVTATGAVSAEAIAAALRPDTALCAVMLVNNELGTVQPIAAIARALDAFAAREGVRRPHLHVDAVQAFGLLPVRAVSLGADSLALSAHKIHGGRGAGALWLRPGARIGALWDGGGQEQGARSGTENLPAIVGFACAARLARAAQAAGATDRIAALRDELEARVCAEAPGARRTLSATDVPRAPHITSLAFPGLPAEPLLHALEARGVLGSAGSACASKTRGPSHVLRAIGVDDDTGVLRLSLSRQTTPADIARAVTALTEAAAELRGSEGATARRRARP